MSGTDDASARGAWFRRGRIERDPNVEARIEEAQRLEAGANALLDMAGRLASATSPQDVDKAIIGAANEICGSQRGLLLRWDPAAEVLKNTAWTGFSAELQDSLARLEVRLDDTQLLGVALATDEAIIVRHDTDDDWIRRTLEALNCSAAASIAIRAFDAPFSVLSLHYDDADLDEEVVGRWLRKVADLAGRAYETAAVIEAQAERVERLGGQKQILEMVARGEDLRNILETVCVTVEAHVPASMGAIFLLDKEGDSLQMVAGPNVPSELAWELNGTKLGPFSGSAGSAVFREHAVYAVDISTDRVWQERREIAQRHGLKAAWALPIFAAGGSRVLGALTVYLTRLGRPDEGERGFMEMAAHLTSIAIERRELETQLTHQAFHDSLTGLPNRALFADRVQHALDRTARNNEPISLLLLDLDDFKSVNDTLGHPAGDELLQAVAERIRRCLRSGDTPARLGGDEFAILLEGADEAAARTIAERLLTMLQDPIRIMGIEMRVSGSIGIVQGEGSKDKMDDLLRGADTAMYAAKGQGKGRFEMFETRMQSGLLRRLEPQADAQRPDPAKDAL